MGKQAGPSPEELELIFECFTRGLSDSEVLDEMQGTEFPLRNLRFLRDRRRHWNAAQKVLEARLKTEIDPSLAKAREEHFTEIRRLIENLLDVTRSPYVLEVSLGDSNSDYDLDKSYAPLKLKRLENNKLFPCLRSHLPSSELWDNYSLWKERVLVYVDSCTYLIKQFMEDDAVKAFRSQYPKEKDEVFYRPLLRFVNEKALGREPTVVSGQLPEEPEELEQLQMEEREERERRTGRKYKYYSISSRELEYFDPEICCTFLNSEVTNKVIILFNELKTLEGKFREPLRESLISRGYQTTICGLCPGQAK